MTKTLTEQLEEWKELAEYDIPDYIFEDVRMMLLAAEQRGREEIVEEYLRDVNRVEVIDHTKPVEEGGGRAYVFWEDKADVTVSIQDENRTLKVFIKKPDEN